MSRVPSSALGPTQGPSWYTMSNPSSCCSDFASWLCDHVSDLVEHGRRFAILQLPLHSHRSTRNTRTNQCRIGTTIALLTRVIVETITGTIGA